MTNPLPDNPYEQRADEAMATAADEYALALATLAAAWEARQLRLAQTDRNRLAAITAQTKGIALPADLAALAGKE